MSGAQSILVKNIDNYQQEFDNKILSYGEDYSLYRRFMIGEGLNYEKMMHAKMFHRILCTDNCNLKNYIWDKINGRLKDKCDKRDKISTLLKKYREKCKKRCCSDSEAIRKCVGKIEW